MESQQRENVPAEEDEGVPPGMVGVLMAASCMACIMICLFIACEPLSRNRLAFPLPCCSIALFVLTVDFLRCRVPWYFGRPPSSPPTKCSAEGAGMR